MGCGLRAVIGNPPSFGGRTLSPDRRPRSPQDARALALALAVLGGVLLLAGCSAVAPFSAAPRLPPAPTTTGPGSGAAPSATDRPVAVPIAAPPPAPPSLDAHDPRRRQYYDQARKRYYFFDPVAKRYFWSDGTPK